MNNLNIDVLRQIASFLSLYDRVHFARINSYYLEALFPDVRTSDVLIKHHVHQQLEYLKKEWVFCCENSRSGYAMFTTRRFYKFALVYAKRNRHKKSSDIFHVSNLL